MRIPYVSAVRLQWITAVVVFRIMLLSGCASDDSLIDPVLPGTLPDSPGMGSATLQVTAAADIEDTGPATYETKFSATLSDSLGAPVSGASVTFVGAFGTWTLVEDGVTAGLYTSARDGIMQGSYTLNVRAGSDSLTGLTVTAPYTHTIGRPARNETVAANTALNVRWSAPTKANECRLATRDYDSGWIFGDTETLWVPSVGNPPRIDQHVRITRRNVQLTNAGLGISQLSVSVRRTVEPIIAE